MYAAAIITPRGMTLYYTGRAGSDHLSVNVDDAFYGYSEEGALQKAQRLCEIRTMSLCANYTATTVKKSEPEVTPDNPQKEQETMSDKYQTAIYRTPTDGKTDCLPTVDIQVEFDGSTFPDTLNINFVFEGNDCTLPIGKAALLRALAESI